MFPGTLQEPKMVTWVTILAKAFEMEIFVLQNLKKLKLAQKHSSWLDMSTETVNSLSLFEWTD